jgi:prevent-host-death family protein
VGEELTMLHHYCCKRQLQYCAICFIDLSREWPLDRLATVVRNASDSLRPTLDTDRTYSYCLYVTVETRGSDVGELIGLGQLRSNAIGYLERVLAGETLEVARRGKLVARIVSASGDRPAPTMLPDLVVVNGAGARVGLGELRTRAGRCFDRVAAGETIWVVWRGKMVAKIALPCRVGAGARLPVQLDQLRSRAGRYFDRVAEGETIEVVRRGKLVGRIVSAAADPRDVA